MSTFYNGFEHCSFKMDLKTSNVVKISIGFKLCIFNFFYIG